MKQNMHFLLVLMVVAGVTECQSQETRPDISAEDLRSHVRFLASDELEGRGSGTEGNVKAAQYIVTQFEKHGLSPGGDNGSYLQTFDFVSGVSMGPDNSLSFSGSSLPRGEVQLVPDTEFRPFGFSSSEEASGEVVFVGYGISAPDEGYDDYGEMDVSGKIVIALRYSPKGDDPHSAFSRQATFRSKARLARERRASGLIIVTGPEDDPDDDLVTLAFDQAPGSGLPVLSMKHSVLDQLLAPFGTTTGSLQDSIAASGQPHSMLLSGISATLRTQIHTVHGSTANIVGFLTGHSSQEQRPVLVIGAHMDHLGYGGPGSGSLDPDNHAIHNGADDNASGTAGLLELAERFSTQQEPPDRGIVFIAFSGEELGTLGSAFYVAHPFVPLEQTSSMINMDMIGRLSDSSLTVYGTGTASEWDSLVEEENRGRFHLKKVADGFGPSDHSQFYGKDIPVLFFFTGTHDDYHKPSDDWDKINYDGERDVVTYVYHIATRLAESPVEPTFVRVQSGSQSGESGRVSFRVTLGVVPDYASEETGMKIGGVRPDGPAERAGLQGGDVIVGMAGKEILNIYDYMAILGTLGIGDAVEIAVVRNGEPMTFTAVMTKRE